MKEILTDIKGETDSNTIIVGDDTTSLSKEIVALNDLLEM